MVVCDVSAKLAALALGPIVRPDALKDQGFDDSEHAKLYAIDVHTPSTLSPFAVVEGSGAHAGVGGDSLRASQLIIQRALNLIETHECPENNLDRHVSTNQLNQRKLKQLGYLIFRHPSPLVHKLY